MLAHQVGGIKGLACQLRPEIDDEPEKAHRWLLDALNPDRPHEIHPAQIGRENGCHVIAAFLLERMGYQPPVAGRAEISAHRLGGAGRRSRG